MSILEKNSDIHRKIELFFIIFILFQPILDLLAFIGLPLSTPIRALAMLIGFIYILFKPGLKHKKKAMIYIFILGFLMLINLITTFMFRQEFSLTVEIEYIIKTTYVILMVMIYTYIFKAFSEREDWQRIIQKYVSIALSMIGAVMVIAELTDTGKRSYNALAKAGHSGWFFSANELSAILAMGLGIILLYFISSKVLTRKMIMLPFLFFILWSMLTIGTKVGLIAMLIVLATVLVITLIDFIKNRKKWHNLVLVSVLAVFSVFMIPNTAIGNNLDTKVLDLFQFNNPEKQGLDQEKENIEKQPSAEEVRKVLLSGRGDYLANQWEHYDDAPMMQKVFGMGRMPKLVEMDFFDYFFNFGVVGLITLFAPFIFIGFIILRNIWKSKFALLNRTTMIFGIGAGLGLGIAFAAGHILSAPASGYYLALLLSFLYVYTDKYKNAPKDEMKEEVNK
ncbi:O-antigen ligase family protein [Salinibacillus aidingensis]|uniref:O-antigen ligase family protein n=1 Tax=Salinibacillus aidingensis TaxID=237684 RepID=A0ABP3KX56_9BACI